MILYWIQNELQDYMVFVQSNDAYNYIPVPITYACWWYLLIMYWYPYGMEMLNWTEYNLCHSLYVTHLIKKWQNKGVQIYTIPCNRDFYFMICISYKEWWYMWVWTEITGSYIKSISTWNIFLLCYVYYYIWIYL